ncbi:sulfate transporter [Micromonospora rosaria]|uniref:Sulfate transporter n=1 Tax=Micromonospora rosaria TaxID=47874 RepID=A0A136PX25_9ACTN|nr:ATP-binding protein [Micromonospora rosaria]KXK62965.1 sulfate transporter [Micromonospora rosaria]
MPTDVQCLVETDGSTTVVRLSGLLTPAGADTVRDILLTRLCARPGPLVVDLSALRSAAPGTGRLFAEVHRAVADWPAAGLLILDPGRLTLAAGSTPPGPDAPPVCATPAEALAVLAGAPAAAPVHTDLAPVVGAAREARVTVTESCARWGLPELAEPGCIAVTEMVNNAVAHARTGMTLRLAPRAGALHLAVRDYSRRQPAFAGLAPPTSTGGRGLLLIDTVARRWGSTDVPDGKVVWCVLYAEDEAAFRH